MGRRRTVAAMGLLLLLVLAVIVTWLALNGGAGDAVRRDGVGATASAPTDDGAAYRERVTAPRAAAVDAAVEDAATPGPVEPEVVPEPWPESGVEVDVVVEEGRTPAPHALLFVRVRTSVERASPRRPDADTREFLDEYAVIRRTGRPYRADDAGHVRLPVPLPGEHLRVGCEHEGGLVGQLGLSDRDADEPQTLLLMPRLGLRVRVVDGAGEPIADFPVHLLVESAWDSWTIGLAETGIDGVAAFYDLGGLRDWGDDDDTLAQVRPAIPMADPPRAVVDVRAASEQQLQLVVANTGSVRVTVLPPAGESPVMRGYVSLDVDRDLPQWYDDGRVLVADIVDGVATFPWVGVGVDLVAKAVDEDERLASARAHLAGPRRSGERVDHELHLDGARIVVVGRVVDDQGAPVADLSVSAGAKADHEDGWMQALGQTDGAGRFRLDLDHSRADLGGRRLVLQASVRIGRTGRTRVLREQPLPPTLPAGPIDVGDVVLGERPLVVSGRVVDRGGNPLAGVMLGVRHREGEHWVSAGLVGESGGDGRFAVRGDLDGATRLQICPQDTDHVVPAAVEIDVGAEDVVIVVVRAGTLSGSLRLPPGAKGEDLTIVVTGSASQRHSYRYGGPGRSSATRMYDDGRFEAMGLVDGVADVAVLYDGFDEQPLAVVRGVTIVAGQANSDPRLTNIDLTAHLRPRSVRVIDDRGSAVAQALVRFRRSGSDEYWHDARADAAGRAVLSLPPGPIDVLGMATGFASASAIGVGDAVTLRLPRAHPVEVTVALHAESAIPPDRRRVVVKLAWLAAPGSVAPDIESEDRDWWDPRSDGMQELPVARGEEVTIQVVEPGWYVVQTMLEDPVHYTQWPMQPTQGGAPFELAPGSASHRVVLRLTEADVKVDD